MDCQKHFRKLQKMKNTILNIKPIKIGKQLGTTYCLYKDYTKNFRPEKVKKGLLSNLGIKTPLSKIPTLNVLFRKHVKMNEIVNTFLLVGDKFMPEMHLKQTGFTYSACGPFTKNEERIEKFMQTGNTNFIYQVNLIKLVFNMIWLMANQRTQAKKEKKEIKRTQAKRAQADKDLKHKTFKTASNPKYDGYRR